MFQITLGLFVFLLSRNVDAFVPSTRNDSFGAKANHRGPSGPVEISLKSTAAEDIEGLKVQIENEIKSTKRGLSASSEQREKIDSLVQTLESLCPFEEPAREPEMGGRWIVDYTTAPPPSNGKLGPFEGIARQIIDLDKGTYVNYLSVPGDIEKEFLSAKLEATFEEWTGELLKDDRIKDDADDNSGVEDIVVPESEDKEPSAPTNWFQSISSIFEPKQDKPQSQKSTPDYGADSWKVDFKTLTIKLFGFKVLEKSFDEGTSRVWKMSYLDKEGTRVVRAGRTGLDKDAMLFYMQKE